ncbi:MAG TPA: glutathione binding-like protein, partial [bacterium]|nr:glutathione binding-like protein [bacterium]
AALAGREHVVSDHFTVADLNLAALLSWVRGGKVDTAPYSNLQRWLTACLARPAFKAAQGKK